MQLSINAALDKHDSDPIRLKAKAYQSRLCNKDSRANQSGSFAETTILIDEDAEQTCSRLLAYLQVVELTSSLEQMISSMGPTVVLASKLIKEGEVISVIRRISQPLDTDISRTNCLLNHLISGYSFKSSSMTDCRGFASPLNHWPTNETRSLTIIKNLRLRY